MTELIPGKRYRWTVEGAAWQAPDGRWCLEVPQSPYMVFPELLKRGAVELLPDPLPTTPGSIVRTSHGKTFVRTMQDSEWPWLNPNALDDVVADDYFKPGFTVLFDAGAQQ